MRTSHLGLRESSLALTSRSRFLYPSATYQEAYLKLLDCLHQRCGIAVLSGEGGTGKTTLLRHLWAAYEADPTVQCLFFAYPYLTWGELVGFICADLPVEGAQEGEEQQLDVLLCFLRTKAQQGETVVLLLDDAHHLPEDVLAQLTLFVGGSARDPALLQIILFGQSPALEEKLRQPRLAPLRRWVSVQCRLEPFTPAESLSFIRARLTAVGHAGHYTVPADALQLIARYARGIPGTIIAICDEALHLARLSEQQGISAELVQMAVHNLRLEESWEEAHLGRESRESTSDSADTWQEKILHLSAGEPEQPSFHVFARPLRKTALMRVGDIIIVLLILWLVAHPSRLEETVPPQPHVRSSSRAELSAQPDEYYPAREESAHIPLQQSVSALLPPTAFPAHVQSTARGHALFHMLRRRYPKIRPFLWGAMTDRPRVALFLPEAEWATLSKEEQVSLTLYLASLIPTVKAEPELYTDASRTQPGSAALRAKVAHMCAECWVIGIGRPTLDGQGVLLDRLVAQGNPEWESSSPPERNLMATQSVPEQRTMASEVQEGSAAETSSQPGRLALLPPAPSVGEERQEQSPQPEIRGEIQETAEHRQHVAFAENQADAGENVHKTSMAGPLTPAPSPVATAPTEDEGQEQGRQETSGLHFGQPPRLSSNDGKVLLKSAETGDLSTVKRLLTAGVSPNEPFPAGWTPLIMAALNGHTTIARLLLEHGADVNATNSRGMTALMYAAWNRHTEIIQLLLKYGARLDVVDRDGWTALQYARDTRFRARTKKDDAVIAALFAQTIARQ